jgi:putative transposase
MWRRRPPSPRQLRFAWLTELVRAIHADSRGTYGWRRVNAELVYGRGVVVNRKTVRKIMRLHGPHGLPGSSKRFRRKANIMTTADLVERRFDRPAPDQLWVTDITEHPTREGKVYCCVVLDVFSRRVVGWAIDTHQATPLVTNALGMAITNRNPGRDQTVIHSDRSDAPVCTGSAWSWGTVAEVPNICRHPPAYRESPGGDGTMSAARTPDLVPTISTVPCAASAEMEVPICR